MQGNLSSSAQTFNRQIETLRTPDLIGDAPSFGATPFEPTSLADASGTIGDDTDDANLVAPPGSILRDRAGTLRVVLPASRKAGRRLRAARRRDSNSRGGWSHIETYNDAAAAMAANDVVWPAALSLGEGVRHGAPVIVVGGQPASLTACDGDVGTSFGLKVGEGDNICDMGVQRDFEILKRLANQTLVLCGPDIDASEVQGWLDKAASALAALLRGDKVPAVPTLVLTENHMAPWARGSVWDCSDRLKCEPVQRSTAATPITGAKRIDPAAFQKMAADLNWPDTDIVRQVGGGGIESNSACEPLTVLAWHHSGLVANTADAAKVLDHEIAEQWASQPITHLPYVPIRILPRNIVLQLKYRRSATPATRSDVPTVEAYLKPRCTMDGSYGGIDSVNAGVPPSDRDVTLPSIQMFAKALGILALAADGGATNPPTEALPYCVDATCAYSFVHVQRAHLWQQCYLWRNPETGEPGVCVYRRLGFGGSFGPNRYQRISSVIGSWARERQRTFDLDYPPPQHIRGWIAEREEAQRAGRLEAGAGQAAPSYLQNYIDDALGVALDDPVPTPSHLAHISIDPEHTAAAGGVFPRGDARVLVHVRFLIHAMERAGLAAAPDNVIVGTPITALGFRLCKRSRLLSVPPLKRAAMIQELETLREATLATATVDRKAAERLLGRLINIAQVLPELKPFLRGGYRATSAAWARRRGYHPHQLTHLARGSEQGRVEANATYPEQFYRVCWHNCPPAIARGNAPTQQQERGD